MISLSNLKPQHGARHRRKIIGRGEGSGHGGSATRGGKGQTARSGDGKMTGFEGGQMPLVRRIPKRGFSNKRFRVEYAVVNLVSLEKHFDTGTEVSLKELKEKGLVKKRLPVKILGTGGLTKSLTVKVDAFSESAIAKIKAAGGKAEVIQRQSK
jgi:large subunit ribosomal protein L15